MKIKTFTIHSLHQKIFWGLILLLLQLPFNSFGQQPGNALNFDGTNDYVLLSPNLSSSLTLSSNNGITIEYWYKGNSMPVSAFRIQSGSNFIVSGVGGMHAISTEGGTTGGVSIGSAAADGRWHHIAMTWQKGLSNGFRSYLDGQLVASKNASNTALPYLTVAGTLGSNNGSSEFMNGSLDEVRVYNTALSQSNIQSDMISSAISLPNSILSYIQFNQGIAAGTNTTLTGLKDSVSTSTLTLKNFAMSGTGSNLIESYAMVLPVTAAATNVTSGGFTINWTAPNIGVVNNYKVEVSSTPDFTGQVSGSPFTTASNVFTQTVTGLNSGTYYYRVRAFKTSTGDVGCNSVVKNTSIAYTQPGNALAFDGSDDYVKLPNGILSGFNNSFTIETWFKWNGGGGWQRIFDFGNGAGNSNILITPMPGGVSEQKPYFYLSNGGNSVFTITSSTPIITGKWYHIAVSLDAATNVLTMYLNGDNVGQASNVTLRANIIGNSTQNWLGRSQYPDPTFSGSIDEFRIWNIARTSAQIKTGMYQSISSATSNLFYNYNFDQGVSTMPNQTISTLTDIAGGAVNGTLNNFSLNGSTSNWVESYALAIPISTAASNAGISSFNANWTAPAFGANNFYYIDVSTVSDFSTVISGSPFTVSSPTTTKLITGLLPNTNYFYRVRAERTSVSNQGGISNTIIVRTATAITAPGNCLSFDGSNDVVLCPKAPMNLSDNFTIETWVYPTQYVSNWQAPFSYGYDDGSYGDGIAVLFNNGYVYLHYPMLEVINSNYRLPQLNHWYHIALTRQNGIATVYVDGVAVISGTRNFNAPTKLYIGAETNGFRSFSGSIDEFRMYSQALTPAQIQQDLRDTISVLPSALVCYYNFDEGSAGNTNTGINLLTDKGPNQQTGNLVNFALSGSSSNWVSSYAAVVPIANNGTAITSTGFTANWNAPFQGSLQNYIIDVSTTSDFTAPISGSPFTVDNITFSKSVSGLIAGTYYYRVRANHSSYSNQGAWSNTISVLVPYAEPGNCLALDGTNAFVVIPSKTLINQKLNTNKITIEGWFKISSYNFPGETAPALISEGFNGDGIVKYDLSFYHDILYTGFYNGSWHTASIPTSKLELNRWMHIASTYDQQSIKLYINGVLVSSTNETLPLPNGTEDWYINKRWDFTETVNASFDEVRIWNVTRTPAQIFAGMHSPIDPASNGLVAYYNFNQGVAGANNSTTKQLFDLSPNAMHGQLKNCNLSGNTQNWVESYAMVTPYSGAVTNITPNSFKANWTAPITGSYTNYYLDIASTEDFKTPINGSPFNLGSSTLNRTITDITGGTYYYRVRANKASTLNQGGVSTTVKVDVPYTNPGNALAFDGINDYARSFNSSPGNFGASDFTVEYWLKTVDNHGYHITKRGDCAGGNFWSVYQGINSNPKHFYIELNNGGNYPINLDFTIDQNTNDGRWHHFAMVRSGVRLFFYIDNVIVASGSSNGIGNVNNGGRLYFAVSTCWQPFNCSMDEVRLWTVARTAEQLKSNMNGPIDPNTPGLSAYYNFDVGDGGLQNYGRTTLPNVKNNSDYDLELVNMDMEALNTNWVQSYATVVPTQIEPDGITPNGFTLNWTTPPNGPVSSYFVDISLSSNFTAPIPGSPFTVAGNATSYSISGLASSKFYCRIRANYDNSIMANEGAPSNVKIVDLKYTPPGNALQFDGNNDYGNISRNIQSDFTVEYWMRTTQTGNNANDFWGATGIVDMEVGGQANDFGTGLASNKLMFGVGTTSITSVTPVNTGKWYHVAVTRKQSDGSMKLYINGNLEATGVSNTGLINGSSIIRLGSVNTAPGNSNFSFNGAIDELRIWNVVRTQQEIFSTFNDTVLRSTDHLVSYYNMDQGIGGANNTGVTTLIDIAGTDNGGTITNFSLTGTSSNWVNTYNITVGSPNSLTATTNLCSRIDLNWQIAGVTPSTNCDASLYCDANYFRQYVYADDSLLAIFPYNTTSCSFYVNNYYNNTKLIRGFSYKFKVVTVYLPNLFHYVKYSNPTNISIGQFKDNPEIPAGFKASLTKCDGSIDLDWTWTPVTNPQNGFLITRGTDSSMTNAVNINVAGQIRSYTDVGLQRGQMYLYRISAKNDCYDPAAVDSMFAGMSDTMAVVGGKSPTVPNRATNVRLFADSTSNQITIRWNDNSDFEDKYSVDRIAVNGGTASFDVNPNDTMFVDDQAAGCVSYNYTIKVYSGCATNGIPSIGLNQTRLTPILSNTFEDNSIYKLHGSKGFYPDRVELNWNNRNNAQLSNIRIYRKIANSSNDSILIASVLPGSGLYIDNTTVAGVLYNYFLIGETQCAGVTRFSNITSDIGFRSPSGVINGSIAYSGGYAVPGVRVLAQNTSANKGGSIQFGGNGSYIEIPHKNSINSTSNALTLEAWYKPGARSNFVIAHKRDSANRGYSLRYDSISDKLMFIVSTGTDSQMVYTTNPFVSFTSFNQITAVFGADSMRLYINGINASTIPTILNSLPVSNGSLYIGADPSHNIYSNGSIDEVRFWEIAKTKTQIVNDFNRTVEPNDANLLMYLTFDDRFPGLKNTYDQSNLNLVFNENHGNLIGNTNFSDSIPSSSQLALASYTDAAGNYTIANVRYLGTGQNYTLVPSLDIHTFTPNNHVVFVGDGSQSINGQNFLDNSSFEFTGFVRYAGTTCPASGASVLIDGQHAVLNSVSVTVNDSGKFTVRVPIGNHAISLSNLRHTFSQGRFPQIGTYNFEGPISANFVDSTFLTVVGRVAGGNRELNKLPGMGRGKNNIGKARFTFNSVGQSGINGCFSRQVTTNDSSGEYRAYLLPLRYTIDGLKLVNNADPTVLLDPVFNNPNVLDLTTIPELTSIYDTLVTSSFSRIDSVKFHQQLDFKYYNTPKIYVTNLSTPFDTLTNNFIGENKIVINDTTSISVDNNELGYPVFQQSNQYWALVKVMERYINIDKAANDSSRYDNVPVSGTLRFTNDLALNDTTGEVEIDGSYIYGFRAGVPNQLRNSQYPQYNYTRTMQIDFVPQIGYTVSYTPNETDPISKFYRAIIFGSRPGGNNFTTRGPALVDFVLRDPPGSLSSATWTKGTSFSKAESYSFENSFSRSISNETDLGEKMTTFVGVFEGLGAGAIEGELLEEETKANLVLGVSTTMKMAGEGEIVTSTTMNTTISTGSDPGSVGPDADVYYGKSINIIFGNSDDVELVDTATCSLLAANAGTEVCSGNIVNGYRIGKKTGFFIVPGGIATTFAYTQDEIINQIIPDLMGLRNQLILNSPLNIRGQKKYSSVFNDVNDPDFTRKFASNNDDPIWGGKRSTPTPFVRESSDSIGQSYIFRGNSRFETDSVRFYNDQIRLWKNAIARNEAAKYKALNNSGAQPVAGGRNISIGKAMLSEDLTTQVDQTYSESFEVSFDAEISETVGFEFLGVGHEMTNTFSFNHTSGRSRTTSKSIYNTFAYTLQDGDDGDLISVDIIDPKNNGSHLFKLRAGHTSCPYEGAMYAHYFDPSNDTITATTELDNGFEIQPATAQNDVPLISVDRRVNFNVPASDEAVFVLNFGNLSESHQDRTYSLRVNESTNPFGAILKVDGLDPNRDFDVPYGTTIQKTLTIKRGPLHFDYDNIQLILKSPCDDNIFDTVSVSARFLPTCTSASIKSPDNRWILNSAFHDTLPVVIGGYNYNWGGFKTITLQYRPGATNTWYTEKVFYKDTSNADVKIPLGDPTIFYPFNFKNLPDGNYELRVTTECIVPGYPNSRISSDVMQGLVDRVNPTPFGTPSPANGILSPNDDISIQFNEPIEQSTLSVNNFDIKGVLNKSNLRSNTSLYFDGISSYLDVDQGMNLQNKAFSLESWIKRAKRGSQVLFSQGADTGATIEFGFTNDDKLYFKLGSETVMANTALTDTSAYQFVAVSYNNSTQTADLYINEQVVNIGNNRIYNPYNGSGRFYMGKAATGDPRYFKGNMYEARVWNSARSLTDCNQSKSILLNGTENGLQANWRMDEATGKTAKDYARAHHAIINQAQWFLNPMGKSYAFHGNGDFITLPTSHLGITKEMDFTLEFWFKGSNGNNIGLMSNGTGLASATNPALKWSIETDSISRIHIKHNGVDFLASDLNFFDGNWHHVAIILKRNSSLSFYVDALLQNSMPSGAFEQFGGLKMWVGARGWNNNGNLIFDSTSNYFNGVIDDIRIWNCSRLLEQIKRDKNTRLNGTETGLLLYYPFESYKETMGVSILDFDNSDFAGTNTRKLTSFANASFSTESPTLKLPSGAQRINFTYGVNNDKIIITPTTANEYIENVTLDITVKGINDKNGNTMQSPKTWIAYVDRNQVKWQDDALTFNKVSGAALSFTSRIVNSGGALKSFTIGNLPSWLRASITSSTIAPSSTLDIQFTIDPTVNIGKYEQDLSLMTDFGFADKLLIKLNVNAVGPKWSVNTSNFAKTMNIVGQVRINNVISANTDDLLGAFVGNECRGVGHVQYYDQLDKYLVFMDVYGNTENEPLEFRIWNSATGKTHIQVTPVLNFISNSLIGTVNLPQVFNAYDKVYEQIPLAKGWNWISFNLLMNDSSNFTNLFNKLNNQTGNLIKNNTLMSVYDSSNGWNGSMNASGVHPESSYLYYTSTFDTLEIRGIEANPELRIINLNSGWNYLGFVSQRNMAVNDALAGWQASQNDLIKGAVSFAVYDTILGWVGSLKTLSPTNGYLYRSATTGTFHYPRAAMFGKKVAADEALSSAYWKYDAHQFATTMNFIIQLQACSNLTSGGGLRVGAFVNDQLRGFAKAENNKYYLSMCGVEGETIQFKVLDENSGAVFNLDESIEFHPQALVGSYQAPLILGKNTPCVIKPVAHAVSSKVYPIPFSHQLNIDFNLNQNENITIRLMDISGKLLLSNNLGMLNKGMQHAEWNINDLPDAVYILEIQKDSGTERFKIVKSQE